MNCQARRDPPHGRPARPFAALSALASADAIVAGPNNPRMENTVDPQHSSNPAASMQGKRNPRQKGALDILAEVARSFDALAKAAEPAGLADACRAEAARLRAVARPDVACSELALAARAGEMLVAIQVDAEAPGREHWVVTFDELRDVHWGKTRPVLIDHLPAGPDLNRRAAELVGAALAGR